MGAFNKLSGYMFSALANSSGNYITTSTVQCCCGKLKSRNSGRSREWDRAVSPGGELLHMLRVSNPLTAKGSLLLC